MINKTRVYGEHLTSTEIFKEFILPEIKDKLYNFIWVDLFAGKGNLILPILELIPQEERVDFFKEHIFLFDIQEKMIYEAIKNAEKYGIPKNIAKNNIIKRDTLKNYPKFLLESNLPVYHITNPPYLYIGYIKKHKETRHYLEYFQNENEGYQDLYQLALMNDLRNGIKNMIYIIPSNFLFGYSVSNKIRKDFLKFYLIKKAIIFEKKIFENTGINVAICFFERKPRPKDEIITFEGLKINNQVKKRTYILNPKYNYRAGIEFDEFVDKFKAKNPLNIKFYLTIDDVKKNSGNFEITVIDANAFNGKEYEKKKVYVNEKMYNKIKSNILFVRTVDTGKKEGRVGLYTIKDVFGVDGILVTNKKYRTHPIQIFIEPKLSEEDQTLLKDYFNLILEHFREITDSEFLTTYKYSNSEYIRKYLGLTQVKKLIHTFPLLDLKNEDLQKLKELVNSKKVDDLIEFVKKKNSRGLEQWL
ncbi:MAG: N-6 DNA methylase [Methanococci archaeon]|nr:N-6 DNA methylase [Methanococci archaeon]